MYNIDRLYEENIPIKSTLSLKSDTSSKRQSSSTPDLTLFFSLTFLTAVILLIATSSLPKPRLENHEMCGITTGGQEECFFGCTMVSCVLYFDTLVKDLPCLSDCFERTQNNCVTSLLNDVISKGTCNLTFPDGFDPGPEVYQESNDCELEFGPGVQITKGTCSDATEALLFTPECQQIIFEQPSFIVNTITTLIFYSCREYLDDYYFNFFVENNILSGRAANSHKSNKNKINNKTRLAPAIYVLEDANIRTKLQYENTRHRYPWVCSLRSTGPSPAHRCAVSVLSIPPSPTVLVGAAHCTYLCKDGTREVPVCCCSFGTDDCRESNAKCGDNPGVVEMTGTDSIVICGEWDSSQAMSLTSGERYNVKLPILEIIRHPEFDPEKGPINGKDIVVFKVDDAKIQNNVANTLQLWPACLPSQNSERPKYGIHTGWSNPPPFSFIQSQASGFAPFYNDFYKQWHYKMDIFDICEDPKDSALCGGPLKFPSNTSYPAATVCAKDMTRRSCFSTGDSGSPLMVNDDFNPDRYQIEGILSFVKGCSQFEFGLSNQFSDTNTWVLSQKTENPTAYTKLSCFLPWVAAQYNMRYELTGSQDQACYKGSGDPDDGEKQPCRNVVSNQYELINDQEIECKFPFFYNGKEHDECILFIEDDFLYPVFRCPIRDITTKINGTNSFESPPLVTGYCLSDPNDELSALDPNINIKDCHPQTRRLPFSQCKNNCPGVRAFGIIGGGAILAAVGTLGSLSTSSATVLGLGAVGTAGVGGMMIAQGMCAAPFYCELPSGKCCLNTFSINGAVCPSDC